MNRRILVLNTSIEVTTLLTEILQDEGYDSSYAYIPEIKKGLVKLSKLLKSAQPDLIIYDIALPYEENWEFFQQMSKSKLLEGCQIILTTTNKHVLDSLVGPTNTLEIVGKPFDLEILLKLVKKKLKTQKSKATQIPKPAQ
jgi:DNA-binding response OmpR family regulator